MAFAPTIFVEADVEVFTFRCTTKAFTCEPFLHVSLDHKPVVISVGKDPKDQTPSRCIRLFRKPLQPVSYSDYLDAFVRHGVFKVSSGWAKFIRPQLRIRVSERIVEHTGGFYESVFRSSAMNAGAQKLDAVTVTLLPERHLALGRLGG